MRFLFCFLLLFAVLVPAQANASPPTLEQYLATTEREKWFKETLSEITDTFSGYFANSTTPKAYLVRSEDRPGLWLSSEVLRLIRPATDRINPPGAPGDSWVRSIILSLPYKLWMTHGNEKDRLATAAKVAVYMQWADGIARDAQLRNGVKVSKNPARSAMPAAVSAHLWRHVKLWAEVQQKAATDSLTQKSYAALSEAAEIMEWTARKADKVSSWLGIDPATVKDLAIAGMKAGGLL